MPLDPLHENLLADGTADGEGVEIQEWDSVSDGEDRSEVEGNGEIQEGVTDEVEMGVDDTEGRGDKAASGEGEKEVEDESSSSHRSVQLEPALSPKKKGNWHVRHSPPIRRVMFTGPSKDCNEQTNSAKKEEKVGSGSVLTFPDNVG